MNGDRLITNNDIFFIPLDNEFFIVYSPLRKILFRANSSAVKEIQKAIVDISLAQPDIASQIESLGILNPIENLDNLLAKGRTPLSGLTISLTYKCNLACIYCYADGGTRHDDIQEDVILASLKQVIEECVRIGKKSVKITFHGTGETLTKKSLFVWAVETAKKMIRENELNAKFSLVTNGTLLDDETALFLKNNDFSITLSADGFEFIQDKQRPYSGGKGSFAQMVKAAELLRKYQISFSVRATVTQIGVEHLSDIVTFFSEKVLPIGGKVALEPVEVCGRAETNELGKLSADKFIENYKKAVLLGENLGVKVTCSGDLNQILHTCFCSANGRIFCVLPSGDVTSCTRVTRDDDTLSDLFFYARYSPNNQVFEINESKLENLQQMGLSENLPDCLDCFCKWHCAGHCIAARLQDDGHWNNMCHITKELGKWRLSRLIERSQ